MAPFTVSITGFTSIYLVYSLPLWIPFDFLPLVQFNDLQECYLQKRRQAADKPHGQQERDTNFISREGYSGGLDDFQSVLTTFTRYRYYYLSLCYLKYQSYIVGIEGKRVIFVEEYREWKLLGIVWAFS